MVLRGSEKKNKVLGSEICNPFVSLNGKDLQFLKEFRYFGVMPINRMIR